MPLNYINVYNRLTWPQNDRNIISKNQNFKTLPGENATGHWQSESRNPFSVSAPCMYQPSFYSLNIFSR